MQIIIILLTAVFLALFMIGAYDQSKKENAMHIEIDSIAEHIEKTVFIEVEIIAISEKKLYTFTYKTTVPNVRVVSNYQIQLGVQKIYADVTKEKNQYILKAF